MPIINYRCQCGNINKKFFRSTKGLPAELVCAKCKGIAKREFSAPSMSAKITVDNGAQARAVEIDPDIVEVMEERSRKNLRDD